MKLSAPGTSLEIANRIDAGRCTAQLKGDRKMKRILGLLTIILGSTLLLSAQDTSKGGTDQGAAMKGTEMTGMFATQSA
jgi:hypothetical protein